ncbi:MAG TPA: twin-arginine translocase TatA/TatE family subunit [Stellaceae bacterium]|nr:twin-arginine translocase TatA/TatE family subunit [Stellaceae bacterium]
MGGLSIWHWLLLIAVVAVLFGGRGKLTNVMGDFAKGIKAFKHGMKEEETAESETPPKVTQQQTAGTASPTHTEHAATDRT